MTVIKRQPCSNQSLARNDPMYGTASAGSSWVLLELAGGWGHSAFLQSPAIIDPELGRAIVRRVEAKKMRIAAIRKHGRRPAMPRWRWFVAQAGVGTEALYYGEVSDPREYLDLALDGTDGSLSTHPLVAVCAHGKHDQCCAVRGRSACRRLRRITPTSLGNAHIWAAIASLPPCSCCRKDYVTGGSTRPIRRTWFVCISRGDLRTGFSADAPRYRTPSRPPNTSHAKRLATTISQAWHHSMSTMRRAELA